MASTQSAAWWENNIGLAILPESAARRCQKSMAIRIVALTDAWALRAFRRVRPQP
jgi:hypothetical protein